MLAVVAATTLSPLFPFGVARRADPDVGLHVDWVVGGGVRGGGRGVAAMVSRRAPLASPGRARDRVSLPAVHPGSTRCRHRCTPSLTNGLRLAVESWRGGADPALGHGRCRARDARRDHGARLRRGPRAPRRHARAVRRASALPATDVTANTPCGGGDYGLVGTRHRRLDRGVHAERAGRRSARGRSRIPLRTGRPFIPVVVGRAPTDPTRSRSAPSPSHPRQGHRRHGPRRRGRSARLDYHVVGQWCSPASPGPTVRRWRCLHRRRLHAPVRPEPLHAALRRAVRTRRRPVPGRRALDSVPPAPRPPVPAPGRGRSAAPDRMAPRHVRALLVTSSRSHCRPRPGHGGSSSPP